MRNNKLVRTREFNNIFRKNQFKFDKEAAFERSIMEAFDKRVKPFRERKKKRGMFLDM
jgi:hypothetical protein